MNGIYKDNEQQEDCAMGCRLSVTRSTKAQHRGRTSVMLHMHGGWCHLLRVERYPQYSAASVGPGLYILFLFTCSKEVVLGSAVTPIKGARLRSHQDASPLPCLASPRAASPGRPLSLSLSETEGSAVCIVHIVYITAFDYRAWQDIINRATPTRRHNLHSYTISLLLTAIVIFFFKKSLFYFHPIIFFGF